MELKILEGDSVWRDRILLPWRCVAVGFFFYLRRSWQIGLLSGACKM